MKSSLTRGVTLICQLLFLIVSPTLTLAVGVDDPYVREGVYQQRLGYGSLDAATFSKDRTKAITAGPRGIFVWDLATGTLLRNLVGHSDVITCVAISDDGKFIVAGAYDGTIRKWDTASGKLLVSFDEVHTVPVGSIKFSPSGLKAISVDTGGKAVVWDATDGDFVRQINGMSLAIGTMSQTSYWDYVLLAGTSSNFYLYNLYAGGPVQTYNSTSPVTAIAAMNNPSFIVTGHSGGIIKTWSNGVQVGSVTSAGVGTVRALGFSATFGHIIAGGDNGSVAVLTPSPLTIVESMAMQHTSSVKAVLIDTSNFYAFSASADNRLVKFKEFPPAFPEVVTEYYGHNGAVTGVAISPDGTRVMTCSGNTDQKAKMWDSATGQLIREYGHVSDLGGGAKVKSVAFSPDGTKVYTGTGNPGYIRTWSATDGTAGSVHQAHSYYSTCLAASPDGNYIASGGADIVSSTFCGAYNIMNYETTGTVSGSINAHLSNVHSMAFTSDSQQLMTAEFNVSGSKIKLWDVGTNTLDSEFSPSFNGDVFTSLKAVLTPDDKYVVCGTDDDATAKIYELATGDLVSSWTVTGAVCGLAISADGTKLVTSNGNALVTVWYLPEDPTFANPPVELNSFDGHYGYGNNVAFASDGRRVVSGASDGAALVWEVKPPRAIIVAGGGNYSGNAIADQTQELAAYAFRALKTRGYSEENIQLLSAFGAMDADDDTISDVDAVATRVNLQSAITGDFGADAGRLLVILIDHGYKTGNFMAYRLNRSQLISTTRFKEWIDTLQTANDVDLTLLVECCYSGQFCNDLTTTVPTGSSRKILTSTTSSTVSVLLPAPDLSSYLHFFLSSAYMGSSFGEAFRSASDFFTEFPIADQAPQAAQQDSATTSTDIDREFFGASWAYGVQQADANSYFPVFDPDGIMPTATIPVDGSTTVWVKVLEGTDPSGVTVAVRAPAPSVLAGDPVTTVPTYSLTRQAEETTDTDYVLWEVEIGGSEIFGEQGVYTLVFSAKFDDTEQIADPVRSTVVVSNGPDPDETTISAVLAFGDSLDSGVSSALYDLGPFAYNCYYNRFQDNQGVKHDDWISYFGHNITDPLRTPTTPTSTGILNAIDSQASDVGRLYVHLAGDASGGGGVLRLGSGQTLSASDLDDHLDTFQSRGTDPEVILIVDTPGAGHFVSECAATSGQERVVIVSGRTNDSAIFMQSPPISFSRKFLAAAFQGSTLKTSFQSVRAFYSSFLKLSTGAAPAIQPLLDENGDLVYGPADGTLAGSLWLGRRYAFADDSASGLPFILDVTTTQTASAGDSVTYSAALIDGIEPERVFMQLVPPGLDGGISEVLSSLTEVELDRDPGVDVWTWSKTITAPATEGEYSIVIHAEYADGENAPKLSTPEFSGLVVAPEPTTPDKWESAPYHDNDSETVQNTLLGSDPSPQYHTLHDASTDSDWMVLGMSGFDDDGTSLTMPYDLYFSSTLMPSGAELYVDVYTDGLSSAPDTYQITGSGGLSDILLTAYGLNIVYVRVYAIGASASTGARYAVELVGGDSDNNGIVSQIAARTVGIVWETPGSSSNEPTGGEMSSSGEASLDRAPAAAASGEELLGYNIYRSEIYPNSTGWQQVNDNPIAPEPACEAPAGFSEPYILEFADEIPEPVWPPGTTYKVGGFAYEVRPVYESGEGEPVYTATAFVQFDPLPTSYGVRVCVIPVPVGLSEFEVE